MEHNACVTRVSSIVPLGMMNIHSKIIEDPCSIRRYVQVCVWINIGLTMRLLLLSVLKHLEQSTSEL